MAKLKTIIFGENILEKIKRLGKKLLFLPPVIVGILIFMYMAKTKVEPKKKPVVINKKMVRVFPVQKTSAVPYAIGYGVTRPGKTWQMVSEVSGRVLKIHQKLKTGSFIDQGIMLVQIDAQRYKLNAAQISANIENVKSQISQLKIEQQNYKDSLEIEKLSLNVKNQELDRQDRLRKSDTIAQLDYEKTFREVLAQKAKVQELNNSIRLIPFRLKTLQTQRDLYQAQFKEVELDLKNTKISSPFHCRVDEVHVEKDQYVQKGQILATIQGVEAAEIIVQIPMGKLRAVIPQRDFSGTKKLDAAKLIKSFGLSAKVYIATLENIFWEAEFSRFNPIVDSKTRTFGVIVTVYDHYNKVIPGVRPPLTKGIFCKVKIIGKAKKDLLVIPRLSLRENRVYVIDEKNQLKKKDIKIKFVLGNFVVVEQGLKVGEKVIVSDVVPAIEGMNVDGIVDTKLVQKILKETMEG